MCQSLFNLMLTTTYMAGTIIIPISLMWKLRHRRVKQLAQGHSASKWGSWGLNLKKQDFLSGFFSAQTACFFCVFFYTGLRFNTLALWQSTQMQKNPI